MSDHAKLIAAIKDGRKDAYLGVLERNAEAQKCVSVWRAVQERKDAIKLETVGVVLARNTTAPQVPSWVKVGAYTTGDIPCIDAVGRFLDALDAKYPRNRNLPSFTPAHIRCRRLDVDVGVCENDAWSRISTDGEYSLTFVCHILRGDTQLSWMFELSTPRRKHATLSWTTEQEAIAYALEAIRDDCIL